MSTINDVTSSFSQERTEGQVTPDLDMFSLGMTDDALATSIGDRVSQAESYWNQHLKLDTVRSTVDSFYLNNYYSQSDLYDFQIEYKDNRLFVAIETLVALAISNPPQPLVMQAYDTEASYELAQHLQKALLCKYEDLYLKSKFQMVARHLLMGYRLGVMKYRWDDTIGALQDDGSRFGDVVVDVVRPQRVVLDAGSQYIDDIPLIAEYRSAPLEELCEQYPDKKDQILTESGKKAGELTAREGYLEIHNTFYKDGKRTEGIVWKYKKVIMDSSKSPYWNYDETYTDSRGKERLANFLPKPTKPYALFNFMNLGKWVIDDTSLMDQAIPLQKLTNKIGRQIVENAEQANSGTIWNSLMVKQEDVAKLLGDPGERVMAKGDVTQAASRLPYNELAGYVREERLDARNEIDNIFSTHGATKGEVTGSKTLGQDVLSQRGDSARISTLATSIEDGADRLYKGITQCFKVFYDTPQLFRYTSEDSLTSFFEYGRDQIEDNVGLKVKTGSVMPEDPIAIRAETLNLAPLLDPLNLAKGLNKPNPKEWAKQNLMYRLMPDQYMTEVLGMSVGGGVTADPSALQHIELLNKGEEVPPEISPTKEHLSTHQMFMEDPQFKSLDPQVQAVHTAHVQAELANAKGQMGLSEGKPGQPDGAQPQQTPTPGISGGNPASPNPEDGAGGSPPSMLPPPTPVA